MAKVTSKQREAVEARTGDPSFPMETAAQIQSAIRLRGRGKSKGKAEVLRLASAAVGRLLRSGKINESTAENLRRLIAQARERDNMQTDYLLDEYVTVTPGEAFRLFPFGRIVKDGKVREVTKDLAKAFRLPHWRPAIKLGSHGEDTPAGGFITGLEVRDDGLYALPEWNDEGAAAMQRGAYRYHSPEVAWAGGFENPETGEISDAPTIVGDALLHMPHLGEATALYSVEQVTNGGTRTMSDDTVTALNVGLVEAFTAWVKDALKRDAPQPEQPTPEPQGEDYAAKYQAEAEQVELLQAQIAQMEADRAKGERVAHFAAELPDEDAEIHELLTGLPEEEAEKLTIRFKALTEQAKAGNLEQDIGASGEPNGTGDPVAAFDAAVKARMEKDNIPYPAALSAVIAEQPDLYTAYRGGN